jgi:hypothetical protein
MNKTRVNAFCFTILMATILMFAGVALAAPVPDTGQTKCCDLHFAPKINEYNNY